MCGGGVNDVYSLRRVDALFVMVSFWRKKALFHRTFKRLGGGIVLKAGGVTRKTHDAASKKPSSNATTKKSKQLT